MNFSDLARSGTAPSAAKNKTNQILSNNIPLRPKTRGGDNDFVELNYDLRNNKIGTSWGNNQNSLHETDDFSHFQKRQEVEEYEKAMESFHAAVDNWSGKKDGSGGLDLNRRPDSRNKVSKDPKKSQNIYLSGLSAYTQNVPNIILQTSKKTSKVSSTGSPRVRDPKSSNSHMNELRAAYGADFTVGTSTSVKPKSAKSANQYGSLKSYQEENMEASALRSSTANRVMVIENSGIPNRPKTQGSSGGRSALPAAVDSGALSPAKKPLKKPSLFSGGAQTQQTLQQKPLKYFDGVSEVGCLLKSERSGSHPVEKSMWGTDVGPVDSDLCSDHVRIVPDEIEKAADRHGPSSGSASRGGVGALQHAGNRSVVHLPNGVDDERGDDIRGSAQQEDVGEYGTVRKASIAAASGGGDDGATGGSESTATVALERPQSRKLYLGNEKSVLKTTIKAPRSAGARYSNFSPTKGTPTNVFEMNGSEGEVTRQASLKRMSSFSGLTQPAKPWSEDDHLPVRRPPSRQSSAFPVHLADVPPATTTSSSTGAPPKDPQVIHSKSSNGSSFKRRKDEALALVLLTSANSSPPTAGVDLGDRVEGLSHRPPSRQKLAAQHLFEGLHSASQQSSVADLHGGRDGDNISDAPPVSSAPPSSAKPATGRATKGRSTSSSRTVSGLYYNPRDDGFSELDTNGSGGALLPFAITVNYGSPVGNMMPVDGDADYVVVDQDRHVPSHNSNSAHRRSDNGNGAQRRSDTKGTLSDAHRYNDSHESHELMALSSAASELSLISATVHEGQAPRGNRPAAGSWDFAESGDAHSLSRRPIRPKSVASIAVSSNGSGNRVSVPNQPLHLRTKTAGDVALAQSPGTLSPNGRVDGVGWTSGNPFRGSSPIGKPPTRESSTSKEYRSSLPLAKSPVKNVFGGTAWVAEGYTGGSSMRALSSACNSPANFSSDTRDFIQQDDDEDELCGEDLDEDMVTIMTEDSGHSRGDSPLSMRSFTLESSLGEDFLNLFAPAGMR